jgi:hypothetical protein
MPSRLNVKAKKIKTLMQEAGIKRPEGRTCYSHLKHLEDGALIAAYKDGAVFFWSGEKDYERLLECLHRDLNKQEAVCYLYMLPQPDKNKKAIVSLGPILAQKIVLDMGKAT